MDESLLCSLCLVGVHRPVDLADQARFFTDRGRGHRHAKRIGSQAVRPQSLESPVPLSHLHPPECDSAMEELEHT